MFFHHLANEMGAATTPLREVVDGNSAIDSSVAGEGDSMALFERELLSFFEQGDLVLFVVANEVWFVVVVAKLLCFLAEL
jgi:hypothetical protein